ncbi:MULTISPECIES: ThuA domain-containing protein [Maribacter]|uniref:ThuA domain-containing protein n=1 Tax=Maribacter flavus TaxID=1658664 RepID=A0A5B2TQZ3_9FLAO|nr:MULTISPECIES: ThuA domain-containing protein [Maribacter]KAA2217027.1 ThuA domain-containing protein [Maribacter flavus]MDC6405576.1 ThuA domain-containing protein [Maribacter sp. PR66]MEE1972656.1 ThuA domain-containing protein [Maribacter flavus]
MKRHFLFILIAMLTIACKEEAKQNETPEEAAPAKLKALILDGQNNHYVWPKTSMMMKDYLEETQLFDVDIHRMDSVWLGIKYNESRPEPYTSFIEKYPLDSTNYGISHQPIQSSNFSMDFEKYDVIISNLGAESPLWPEATRADFEKYIANGGGLVVVHAANNAWGDWDEFNKMIALGAWGGRDESTGPYVYYNDSGEVIHDAAAGVCGSHGPEYEFPITTRAPEHPIMKGLPTTWMHTQDELYERMRGPFENATILATAFADVERNAPPWNPEVKGLGQNVPMLMAIDYGKGRVFHTTLGHFDYSMECVGFITTLQRGSEWAATGSVTQELPSDFPSETGTSSRKWKG